MVPSIIWHVHKKIKQIWHHTLGGGHDVHMKNPLTVMSFPMKMKHTTSRLIYSNSGFFITPNRNVIICRSQQNNISLHILELLGKDNTVKANDYKLQPVWLIAFQESIKAGKYPQREWICGMEAFCPWLVHHKWPSALFLSDITYPGLTRNNRLKWVDILR